MSQLHLVSVLLPDKIVNRAFVFFVLGLQARGLVPGLDFGKSIIDFVAFFQCKSN